jgi:death-on-curing protein
VTEPLWLDRRWVDALHFQQLSRFGGLHGIRDEGAIESALGRARNQWAYAGERSLPKLAAAYAFGLSRNHGYNDGNKRIAFMAMAVFLDLNGLELVAEEPDVVRVMLSLAAGDVAEEELAAWIADHVSPASPTPSA